MKKFYIAACVAFLCALLSSPAMASVTPWSIIGTWNVGSYLGIQTLGQAPILATGYIPGGFSVYLVTPSYLLGWANRDLPSIQATTPPSSMAGWVNNMSAGAANYLWVANASNPNPASAWYFAIDLSGWTGGAIVNPSGWYEPIGPGWGNNAAVPEPSTFVMLSGIMGMGGLGWVARKALRRA